MGWIPTVTGQKFFPLQPRKDDVAVEDIAHQLALLPKWNGATREHYSIAQHCVLVANMLSPMRIKLHGLLHEAPAAYLGLVGRAIRTKLGFHFENLERDILRVIYAYCEVPYPDSQTQSIIAYADNLISATEVRDLLGMEPSDFGFGVAPNETTIVPVTLEEAEALWLAAFGEMVLEARK